MSFGQQPWSGPLLGAVLALVPLGVGVHGVVAYGRRADRAAAADAEHRRWS
ncbi:hypothetical protein [Streptomyces pseudogriseolus]|uniref:hypothetical protein n=1 Tax=Streptomyces pseudogriseolus TaxID=36817 RepID=UPI003FA341AB